MKSSPIQFAIRLLRKLSLRRAASEEAPMSPPSASPPTLQAQQTQARIEAEVDRGLQMRSQIEEKIDRVIEEAEERERQIRITEALLHRVRDRSGSDQHPPA